MNLNAKTVKPPADKVQAGVERGDSPEETARMAEPSHANGARR